MKEYICKEDLIKNINEGLNTSYFGHDAIEVMAEIEYMPAADVVEVVHARWHDGRCTNCCHEALDYLDDCEMKTYITKYCPECGARMDKENQE